MRKEFKSIPIEQPVWKEMQQRKLDTGDDVYVLVAKAWASYVNPLHALLDRIVASGDELIPREVEEALIDYERAIQKRAAAAAAQHNTPVGQVVPRRPRQIDNRPKEIGSKRK